MESRRRVQYRYRQSISGLVRLIERDETKSTSDKIALVKRIIVMDFNTRKNN